MVNARLERQGKKKGGYCRYGAQARPLCHEHDDAKRDASTLRSSSFDTSKRDTNEPTTTTATTSSTVCVLDTTRNDMNAVFTNWLN